MNSQYLKKFVNVTLLILVILSVLGLMLFYHVNKNYGSVSVNSTLKQNKTPEISGWIAWWAEKSAYDLIDKNPGKIKTVSPVWFTLNSDYELEEIGSVDKAQTVANLKEQKIKVLPSLGSELTGDKLSPFLKDPEKVNALISQISEDLIAIDADGLDVDIEGINKEDKNSFTLFLYKLRKELKQNNMYFAVTIHAQTKKVTWEGVLGQDLKWIGKNADEVRVMTYDEHSGDSPPGAIASLPWIKEVIKYNLKFTSKDKLVMGIPSYGYVWTDEESRGLQFDEYNKYLDGKVYSQKRDKNSAEIEFIGEDFKGWLSDSESIKAKIKLGQSLGINRFVVWHLGGMDEKVFE